MADGASDSNPMDTLREQLDTELAALAASTQALHASWASIREELHAAHVDHPDFGPLVQHATEIWVQAADGLRSHGLDPLLQQTDSKLHVWVEELRVDGQTASHDRELLNQLAEQLKTRVAAVAHHIEDRRVQWAQAQAHLHEQLAQALQRTQQDGALLEQEIQETAAQFGDRVHELLGSLNH